MPTPLGAHNPRLAFARALRSTKGRRAHGLFAFEGSTLLESALRAGVQVQSIFVTQQAYEEMPRVAQAEHDGIAVYVVDERSMRRISDLETPSGIVALAPIRLASAGTVLAEPGLVLGLGDLSDPGNAGTLVRTAQAFGVRRVLFGSEGADPYHPKAVRAAMGAVFEQTLAVAAPEEVRASAAGWQVIGLDSRGEALSGVTWVPRTLLLVGNERRGLGRWGALCTGTASIPMTGAMESLNAAVAGSIALYEAAKRR